MIYYTRAVSKLHILADPWIVFVAATQSCALGYSFYHTFFKRSETKLNSTSTSQADFEPAPELYDTSLEFGLSEAEVTQRRDIYGWNEVWRSRNWFAIAGTCSSRPQNLLYEVRNLNRAERVWIANLPDLCCACHNIPRLARSSSGLRNFGIPQLLDDPICDGI